MVKGEAEVGREMMSKIVDGVEEAEKPSEAGADGEGDGGVPDEESNDAGFPRISFFPSDAGVENVSDDDGEGGGDEIGEPEKVAVFDEKTSDELINEVIKSGNSDADEEVATSVTGGGDIGFSFGLGFGFLG